MRGIHGRYQTNMSFSHFNSIITVYIWCLASKHSHLRNGTIFTSFCLSFLIYIELYPLASILHIVAVHCNLVYLSRTAHLSCKRKNVVGNQRGNCFGRICNTLPISAFGKNYFEPETALNKKYFFVKQRRSTQKRFIFKSFKKFLAILYSQFVFRKD